MMKTLNFTIGIKQVLLILSLLLFAVSFTSCSKKITFQTSSVVPAARGKINVNKDKNDNYKIELQISFLSEPERLQPPKKTYVVWMVSEESTNPINLGQIIGSSKLNVSFETVSSSKPRRIFVTAEDDASIQYPGNMIVLETNNF